MRRGREGKSLLPESGSSGLLLQSLHNLEQESFGTTTHLLWRILHQGATLASPVGRRPLLRPIRPAVVVAEAGRVISIRTLRGGRSGGRS